MNILLIAEHDNQVLKPATFASVTASKQFVENHMNSNQLENKQETVEVTLVIMGYQCQTVLEQAQKIQGIQRGNQPSSPSWRVTTSQRKKLKT